jgi:BirA family biotin operon repressor/biotin-[acetyl-CoA-carboxylase] ligase
MMRLDSRASAAGVRLVAHDDVDSTNTEALRLARAGERGPLWITARRQSAGRGRRGRSWVSEPGNLLASLLLSDPGPIRNWPHLSLVASLALHDAVAERAPQLKSRLALKWPNDLLLAGAKFAGILIEAEGAAGSVAIGIGVNCAAHPDQTEYPATDLATEGATVSAASLFTFLSIKMVGRLAQWNHGEGFPTIRTDWLARAAGLGGKVRVRLSDREVVGRFETIDETGCLVLTIAEEGKMTIAAGDVVRFESSPGTTPSQHGAS